MEKVKFNARVTMPKIPKSPSPQELETARAGTKIKIKIEGTFSADEAGVLELLLKTWHRDGAKK